MANRTSILWLANVALVMVASAGVACSSEDSTVGDAVGGAAGAAGALSSCEQAGGECVALTPGHACAGTFVDAPQYSCGNGVGVGCCMNSGGGGSAGDAGAAGSSGGESGTSGAAGTAGKANVCEQSGGQCVPLTPGHPCADGTFVDATAYPCGDAVGVGCCMAEGNDGGAGNGATGGAEGSGATGGAEGSGATGGAAGNGATGGAAGNGAASGAAGNGATGGAAGNGATSGAAGNGASAGNGGANSCEQAGGSCVGLTPGSCDGTIGDAGTYSCGASVGIECCLPPDTAGPCDRIGGVCTNQSGPCAVVLPNGTCGSGAVCCGEMAETEPCEQLGGVCTSESSPCGVSIPAGACGPGQACCSQP